MTNGRTFPAHWRAALMSMVLPGFGQLANGRPNRAIWLFLGFALVSVPLMSWIAIRLPQGWTLPALVASLAAAIAIWLASVIDAWRDARRQPDRPHLPWQTGGAYLLVFLICNGLMLPALVSHVREHYVASWRIPSASMAPAILRGDVLFADMSYNCPGCARAVARGDVGIFTYPNDRTLVYIKRVVGLPGDQVRIAGRQVWVNQVPLAEAPAGAGTVTERIDGHRWLVEWDDAEGAELAVTVPPGSVFVLGDNRGQSKDSRHFGTVPLSDVVGRARQVWFSKDPGGSVRWSRVGQAIE
ncbi:MAG: signal peptidase I [Zoogloeaceae bacterium]|nr:signal peptidase I [Rhodocyclaceae bacterium]MCP5236899.1 signal peptidase I [Zoogloeaceae bacterium]